MLPNNKQITRKMQPTPSSNIAAKHNLTLTHESSIFSIKINNIPNVINHHHRQLPPLLTVDNFKYKNNN